MLLGHTLAGMKGRHRLHAVIYSAVIAATFLVIIDIEHPREGIITVDGADSVLHSVRDSMNQARGAADDLSSADAAAGLDACSAVVASPRCGAAERNL